MLMRYSNIWRSSLGAMLIGACAAGGPPPRSPGVETASEEPVSRCGATPECEESCNSGDGASCEWLGQMYETGEGVAQDYGLASEYYQRACNHSQATACGHLAMMYDIGLAVPEDPLRAAQLYGRACQAGSRWACTRQEQLQTANP
jgi:TPR repeat protein